MSVTTRPRPASVAGPATTEVYFDGRYLGLVFPSKDRWADGWAVVPSGNYPMLDDQPRKSDAIATLVAFMTSPFRKRDDERLEKATALIVEWSEASHTEQTTEKARELAKAILALAAES